MSRMHMQNLCSDMKSLEEASLEAWHRFELDAKQIYLRLMQTWVLCPVLVGTISQSLQRGSLQWCFHLASLHTRHGITICLEQTIQEKVVGQSNGCGDSDGWSTRSGAFAVVKVTTVMPGQMPATDEPNQVQSRIRMTTTESPQMPTMEA